VRNKPNSVAVSSIGRPATSVRILGTSRTTSPAQHRTNSRDKLTRAERLGQVVVGAKLEPEQLVELVVPGRQHHDRDRGISAKLAGDIEPVQPGQAQIEHYEVGMSLADQGEGGATVGGDQDAEPGVLEVVAGKLGDLWLVVHDEDGLHQGHRSGRGFRRERMRPRTPGSEGARSGGGPPSSRLRGGIRCRRLLG
jgi:hypothetical protein